MAFDGPALDIVHERLGDVAHHMHWHGCAGRYIYFTIGGEHAPRSSGGSGRGKTLRGAVPHPRGPRCNRSLIGYSRLLAPVLRARNAGGRLPSRFNVVIRRRRISRTSISWTLLLLSIYVYTQLPTRQPARIHPRLLRIERAKAQSALLRSSSSSSTSSSRSSSSSRSGSSRAS